MPIRTQAQREVLGRARELAGGEALIPSHKTYVQQLRLYEGQCIRAGLSKMHGLRHAYAQQRFEEITGFKAPSRRWTELALPSRQTSARSTKKRAP